MPRPETARIAMVPTPHPEHQLPVWVGRSLVFSGYVDPMRYRVERGDLMVGWICGWGFHASWEFQQTIPPLADIWLDAEDLADLAEFCAQIAGWMPQDAWPSWASQEPEPKRTRLVTLG